MVSFQQLVTAFLRNVKQLSTAMVATVLLVLLPLQASADDTEIFFSRDLGSIRPNLLFALDTSKSMDESISSDSNHASKMDSLKAALTEYLSSTQNVNVGLMRFNGQGGGGPIMFPITPIDKNLCDGILCDSLELSSRIKAASDDAVETLTTGTVTLNEPVISLGEDATDSSSNRVALKFSELRIPSGVVINSAQLVVNSASTEFGSAAFQIRAENTANSEEITSDTFNISSRPQTTLVRNWFPGSWQANTNYESPDIGPLIQNVINKSDWCGGSSLTLLIEGTGTRTINSFDSSSNDAPLLLIDYDASNVSPTDGCQSYSSLSRIIDRRDDAREWYTGRVQSGPTDTRPFFLHNGTLRPRQAGMMFLRYQGVNIPKDAIIKKAYVDFVLANGDNGPVSLTVKGIALPDTPLVTPTAFLVSIKPTTSTQIAWPNVPSPPAGGTIRSVDLSPIVQEIVNQDGWAAGNALAFRIEGSGSGNRIVEALESNAAKSPALFIEYEERGIQTVSAREELIRITNDMRAEGFTPMLDVMYEAAQYYQGNPVDFGKTRGRFVNGTDNRSHKHRVSHPLSYTGGTPITPEPCQGAGREGFTTVCEEEIITGNPVYISPIQSECQPNSIILLSDGQPSGSVSTAHVSQMMAPNGCPFGTSCIRAVADFLANNDQAAHIDREQIITTHTISFGVSGSFLRTVADAGGGEHFDARDSNDLRSTFEYLSTVEVDSGATFVSPSSSVNQSNRLTNENSIFFSLFEPRVGPTWGGNLKKFNILTKDDNSVVIVDANNSPAIDPNTGTFFANTRSEWSASADGDNVSSGGAASRLDRNSDFANFRNVYTYTGTEPADSEDLTLAVNQLHENNSALTADLMGVNGEGIQYLKDLLSWSRGVDVFDENNNQDNSDARLHMGDPLHSSPVVINYDLGSANDEAVVFVATNEGYLHALDNNTGREHFAFVPQELLPNLDTFRRNDSIQAHPYGLDGSMTFWTDDLDDDGLVDSNEPALLFLGMRRGGYNYYAFDVSNIAKPKLQWVIEGGSGGTPGYEEMGQTWSRPQVAHIRYGSNSRKPVLIFGAGYDENKDDLPEVPTAPRNDDSEGRGIFIVDAETGERLWSASPISNGSNHTILPDMNYSIPSDVRVIDIDADGRADQMYVGDTGGQIWRFDFNKDPSGPLITGGLLADFGSSGADNARRFHNPPDLALIEHATGPYLSLGIGSGWRAHPLDDVIEDRYYTLRLPITFGAPAGYGKPSGNGNTTVYYPYTEADLLDITSDAKPDVTDVSANAGWMLKLNEPGAKVLSTGLTVENRIIFTTYRPGFSENPCVVDLGTAELYIVNAFDGSPTNAFISDNGSGSSSLPGVADRKKVLQTTGIPPSASALISEEGVPVIVVGQEVIDDVEIEQLTERTWWMEAINEQGQ